MTLPVRISPTQARARIAKLEAENERLRDHLQRAILGNAGAPMSSEEFLAWVNEARQELSKSD